MAKGFRPGIPDGFSLDVGPVTDLGDYLDEPSPTRVVQRKARGEDPVQTSPIPPAVPEPVVAAPVASPVVAPPQPVAAAPVVAHQPAPVASPIETPSRPPVSPMTASNEVDREERGGKVKAPRREISMTPETLRMSDELLELVRSGSGQRDTKANELFHALVLLVYEAMDQVDPHTIPKRGRWGTPTARAYPLELKNAFLRALLEKYGKGADELKGLQYPVNSAA